MEYNDNPLSSDQIGFKNTKLNNSSENNPFVSDAVNPNIDPHASYNQIPFYAKIPTIILALLIFYPLGLFLMWRYQRKHLVFAISLTVIYIGYWVVKGFHFYDMLITTYSMINTTFQTISRIRGALNV